MRISDWSSDVCSSDLQHVGKAASRRADVDRGRARYVPAQMHPPMFQREIELDAAARHPRLVAALDADRGIGGDRLPRPFDLAVADEGEAREDPSLPPDRKRVGKGKGVY